MQRLATLISTVIAAAKPAPMLRYNVTLASRVCNFDNTHTFHFSQPSADPMPFEPGMYVHMVAPGTVSISKDTVRHMSFASAPREGTLSFSMDLSSDSNFKQAMAGLQPGDQAELFKFKFKHFQIDPREQGKVVFLAGGLGITPIRSILMSSISEEIDWQLIHVARDQKHLYSDQLPALGGVQVRTDHPGAADAVQAAVRDMPDAWFYLCGSARFVEGMELMLTEAGVPTDKLRIESFK